MERTIEVRWADVDSNSHVRHSAYYDYGAHVRIRFFAECGFDSKRLNELSLGPILFKEECSFLREIKPNDTILVRLLRGAISDDGSRWVLHHEIFNQKGEKCAHVTTRGAWMDLQIRKLTTPPAEMAKAFFDLPIGEDYVYKKSKS